MSKTVLLTGGAGFIGSALVRYLINDTDTQVVNVDKLTYAGSLLSLGGADARLTGPVLLFKPILLEPTHCWKRRVNIMRH